MVEFSAWAERLMAIRWREDIGKWEGDYYDAAGKRRFIYRPEGKKGELEEEIAGILLKKRGGTGVIVSRATFKEFAERWKRDRQAGLIRGARNRPYKPSALRSVGRDLNNYLIPAFGPERLGRIGLDGIEALDADLSAKGLAVSTRRNVFGVLSQILDHAVRKRLIDFNPTNNLELIGGDTPPRRGAIAGAESPLSEAQAEAYIQAAMDMYQPRIYGGKRGKKPMPWGAALPLMAVTALRVGEMYGLEWRHLSLSGESPEVAGAISDCLTRLLAPTLLTVDQVRVVGISKPLSTKPLSVRPPLSAASHTRPACIFIPLTHSQTLPTRSWMPDAWPSCAQLFGPDPARLRPVPDAVPGARVSTRRLVSMRLAWCRPQLVLPRGW